MPLIEIPEYGTVIEIDDGLTDAEINSIVNNEVIPKLEADKKFVAGKKEEIAGFQQQAADQARKADRIGDIESVVSGLNPLNWPGITTGNIRRLQQAVGGEGYVPSEEVAASLAKPAAAAIARGLNWGEVPKGMAEGVIEAGAGLVLGAPEFLPAVAAGAVGGPATAIPVAASFSADMLGGAFEAGKGAVEAYRAGDKQEAAKLATQSLLFGGMGAAIPGAPILSKTVAPALRAKADVRRGFRELEQETRKPIPKEFADQIALEATRPPKPVVQQELADAGLPKTAEVLAKKSIPEGEVRTSEVGPKPTEVKNAIKEGPVKEGSQRPSVNPTYDSLIDAFVEEFPKVSKETARKILVQNDWRDSWIKKYNLTEKELEGIEQFGIRYENELTLAEINRKVGLKMSDLRSIESESRFWGQVVSDIAIIEGPARSKYSQLSVQEYLKEVLSEAKSRGYENSGDSLVSALKRAYGEDAEFMANAVLESAGITKAEPQTKSQYATQERQITEVGQQQRIEAEAAVVKSPSVEALEKLNPLEATDVASEFLGKPEVKLNRGQGESPAFMLWQGLTSIKREGFPPDPISLLKRFATSDKGLSKGAARAWGEHQGRVNDELYRTKIASKELLTALKEHYGLKTSELNRIPVEDIRRINEALRTHPDSDWVNQLPERLREPIRNMRRHTTELSRYLIDNNLVDGELATTISNNLDTYVHRSYRIHDDPAWFWDSIPNKFKEDAVRHTMVQDGISREAAERSLRAYLAEHKEASKPHPKQTGKPGTMDLHAFRQRYNVPEPIRKLMGEYEDPFVNYAKTTAFLSKYIADKEFLHKVRKDGIGRYLFEEGTQPLGSDVLIAAEAGSVLEPLNGLRTDRTTKLIFDEFNKIRDVQGLHKGYLMLVGFGKFGKIVGSVQTQVRNALQMFFWTNSGHSPAAWFKPVDVGSGAKSPLTQAFKAVVSEMRSKRDTDWEAFTREAIRHGLVGDSAIGGEIRRVINTSKALNLDQIQSPFEATSSLLRVAKKGVAVAEKAYQVPDAFGKVTGWVMETKKQQWMHEDMPLAEAKRISAERVKNTYPTFSKLPRWIKFWQRNVPMFNFVPGFTYEIMRTQAWSAWYGAQDIIQGRKTGNKRQVLGGAQRLAGVIAVDAAIPVGLQLASMAIAGVSKEDDEESRQMSPDYERNSARIYTGKGDGKLSYINFSFTNPYPISDAVIAGIRASDDGESVTDAILTASAQLLSPWVEEAPLQKVLIEAKTGKRKVGDREIPLWNSQMSDSEKKKIQIEHIWANALEPGTETRFRKKFLPALKEGDYKKAAGLVASEVTGIKIQTQDLREQLGYQSKEFTDISREISQLFSGKVWREGGATSEELLASYQEQEQKRFELWDSLYGSVNTLRNQGIKDYEIARILKSKNVGVDTIKAVMRGRYVPWLPTDSVMQAAKDKGIKIPYEAIGSIARDRAKLVLTRGIK